MKYEYVPLYFQNYCCDVSEVTGGEIMVVEWVNNVGVTVESMFCSHRRESKLEFS